MTNSTTIKPFPVRQAVFAIACVVLAPCAVAADRGAPELGATQQALFDRAWQSVQQRRYADAYGRFAELADRGHGPSAELALFLYRHGPALFGSLPWSATPGQQRRWTELTIDLARGRIVRADTEPSD